SDEPWCGVPRAPRVTRVVPYDGRLDQPVRTISGDENLTRVFHTERREVDQEVVLVRRRELDLRDLRVLLQYRFTHAVKGLLQRITVDLRELLEQQQLDLVVRLVPIDLGVVVAPACDQRRREDAIVRLRQRRVLVLQEPVELGPGRLQYDEIPDP